MFERPSVRVPSHTPGNATLLCLNACVRACVRVGMVGMVGMAWKEACIRSARKGRRERKEGRKDAHTDGCTGKCDGIHPREISRDGEHVCTVQ